MKKQANIKLGLEMRTPKAVGPHTLPAIMYRAIVQHSQLIFRDQVQLSNVKLAGNSATCAFQGLV